MSAYEFFLTDVTFTNGTGIAQINNADSVFGAIEGSQVFVAGFDIPETLSSVDNAARTITLSRNWPRASTENVEVKISPVASATAMLSALTATKSAMDATTATSNALNTRQSEYESNVDTTLAQQDTKIANIESTVSNNTQIVYTVAELRSVEPTTNGQLFSVKLNASLVTHTFFYDDSDSTSADDALTLIVTENGSRIKKLRPNKDIYIEDFGSLGTMESDYPAFIAAVNYAIDGDTITTRDSNTIKYFGLKAVSNSLADMQAAAVSNIITKRLDIDFSPLKKIYYHPDYENTFLRTAPMLHFSGKVFQNEFDFVSEVTAPTYSLLSDANKGEFKIELATADAAALTEGDHISIQDTVSVPKYLGAFVRHDTALTLLDYVLAITGDVTTDYTDDKQIVIVDNSGKCFYGDVVSSTFSNGVTEVSVDGDRKLTAATLFCFLYQRESGFGGHQLLRTVTAVNASTGLINIDRPLPFDFKLADSATISRLTLINNISIKLPDIEQDDPGARVNNNPSADSSGSNHLSGAMAGHIVHLQGCINADVQVGIVDGFQLHAVNFQNCINSHCTALTAKNAFRPQEGGHGYGYKDDRSYQCSAQRNYGYKVRHGVDHTQTEACYSAENHFVDTYSAAILNHGLHEIDSRSVDDTVTGDCNGWAAGNPSFDATYGFTIERPIARVLRDAIIVQCRTKNVTVLEPDIFSASEAIKYTSGAENLKIRGGKIGCLHAVSGQSYAINATIEQVYENERVLPPYNFEISETEIIIPEVVANNAGVIRPINITCEGSVSINVKISVEGDYVKPQRLIDLNSDQYGSIANRLTGIKHYSLSKLTLSYEDDAENGVRFFGTTAYAPNILNIENCKLTGSFDNSGLEIKLQSGPYYKFTNNTFLTPNFWDLDETNYPLMNIRADRRWVTSSNIDSADVIQDRLFFGNRYDSFTPLGSDMTNRTLAMAIDESTGELKIRAKYLNGTTVNGTILLT